MVAGGGHSPPSDNFLGALKLVIANVRYHTKYVKSSLSTDSKIVLILAFLMLFKQAIVFENKSIVTIFRGAEA